MEDMNAQPTTPATPEKPKVVNIEIANVGPELMQAKLEEMTAKLVNDEFTTWANWRRNFESLWDEIYKLYFSSSDNSKTPTRAKIFIPIVFQTIEAVVPKVLNTLFNGEEFFDVQPVVAADEPAASSIKLLLLYQLAQSEVFLKYLDFSKQLFMYGTSYLYVYWKVRRQWVYKKQTIRGSKSFFGWVKGTNEVLDVKESKEYKVVEKRPEMDVLDILDVYPDPNAKSDRPGENGKAVWVRTMIDLEELKELGKGPFPMYDNTESPDLTGSNANPLDLRANRISVRGLIQTPTAGKVEILTRWGLFDLDGDGIREETQIVWANRKVIIKAKANPFHHQKRPVIRSVCFPVLNEWYGVGLIEPIIPLQHEINTLRRQRLDNINIILNRMWLVSDMADVDIDTLISAPNGVILTKDMKGVQPLDTNDVTQSNYLEVQNAQNDIENATITKAAQGTPESGRLGRTASGAKLIVGAALEKFGVIVRLIEESSLKRVLRMYHQLNIQMINDDESLRDPGMYGHLFDEQINAEMIKAEVKFKMVGVSEMIGKEAKINQVISYMGVFGNFLDGASITALAKKVYELMGFDPDMIEIQGMANPAGMTPPGLDQQTGAAVTGQALRNGSENTPTIPGTNQTGA